MGINTRVDVCVGALPAANPMQMTASKRRTATRAAMLLSSEICPGAGLFSESLQVCGAAAAAAAVKTRGTVYVHLYAPANESESITFTLIGNDVGWHVCGKPNPHTCPSIFSSPLVFPFCYQYVLAAFPNAFPKGNR